MNSTEAFTRATLYHSCLKSDILKHVDIDNADLDTLRDLVNKHSLLNSRKLPIIISKLLTKKCLEFVINKFPNLKNTLTPQNIRIDVEDDELAYLMNSTSSFKPNIVCLVTKNIVISLLGSSIEAFKTHLINSSESESSSSSSSLSPSATPHVPKIVINPTKINLKNHAMPTKFTETFNTNHRPNNNSITTKELVAKVNKTQQEKQKLNRQNTIDSNRSNYNNTNQNDANDDYDNDDEEEHTNVENEFGNNDYNKVDNIDECTKIPTRVDELSNSLMNSKPIILENIKLPHNHQQISNVIPNAHQQTLDARSQNHETNANILQNTQQNSETSTNNSPDTHTIEDDIKALDDDPIILSDNEFDNNESRMFGGKTKKSKPKSVVLSDLSAAVIKPKAIDFMELIASTSPDLLNEKQTNDEQPIESIVIDDEYGQDENNKVTTNGYSDQDDDYNESIYGEETGKYIELERRRSISVASSRITDDNFTLYDDDDDF